MWVHIVDMFHMTGDVSGRRCASSTYLGSDDIAVVPNRCDLVLRCKKGP